MSHTSCVSWRLIALTGLLSCTAPLLVADDAQPVDFSHEIVPLLKKHCVKCHTGDSKKGGFSFNTRAELLEGSENGPVIETGKADDSRLIHVVVSDDPDQRMPPEGERLAKAEIELLKRWVNQGTKWEDGFAFKAPAYEPPLKPRQPELPPPARGEHTRSIASSITILLSMRKHHPSRSTTLPSRARTSLDIVGLLPEREQLQRFLNDKAPDKRARWIDQLLADDMAYAEHWLTFWNDLLRNDYDGTGFITGGRKQISGWLYEALIINKPYNQSSARTNCTAHGGQPRLH